MTFSDRLDGLDDRGPTEDDETDASQVQVDAALSGLTGV
jgi:hypothetical protein